MGHGGKTMTRKKTNLRLLQLLLATLIILSFGPITDGANIRGLWVVRGTMQSKEAILEMLDKAQEAGINHVFVQVNMSGFAYYQSERLPLAISSFDPLDFVIKEAHLRGIKVHAWLNAFTVGALGSKPTNKMQILYQHPEWALVDIEGVSVLDYQRGTASESLPTLYLEPGLKGVQDWVVENFLEVVSKYDVDGLHFDFIRYPSRNFGYHPEVVREFEDKFGFKPQAIVKDYRHLKEQLGRDGYKEAKDYFDDFRRDQITNIVRRVYEGTKEINPNCLVSAAVFPIPADAVDQKFQDWFLWLKNSYLDFACPMIYDTEDYILSIRLADIERLVDKNKIIVGLGPYKDTVSGTLRKIETVEKKNFAGFMLFSYDSIKDSSLWSNLQ